MSDEKKSSTEIRLTDEQRAALTTRGTSIGLTAGAGCGKTFVLTHRFLNCLEPDTATTSSSSNPLQKTVAITFTDRAAREMRDRIRSACQQRISTATSSSDIEYWQRILRGLDLARISTIHAFCTGILRSHAAELGIDPNFRLMEGTETTSMVSSSIEQVVHKRLADQDEVVMRIVGTYELERTIQILWDLLKNRFRVKPDQFDKLSNDDWKATWKRIFQQQFVPASIAEFAESPDLSRLENLFTEHQPKKPEQLQACKTVLNAIRNLRELSLDTSSTDEGQTLLTSIMENATTNKVGRKQSWNDDDAHQDIVKTMKSVRDEAKKRMDSYAIPDDDFDEGVQWSRDFWELLKPCWQTYEDNKRRAGVLDFDDLLVMTRNLLAENKTAQQRLSRGIDFLLIDEFQDTDPIQTEIVRCLCDSDVASDKLFLVGDVKQSIYRFRRADPQVFLQLRSEIPTQGQLPLLTNFRSRGEIIYFVNGLFADEFSTREDPLVPHRATDSSLPPRIEFLFPQIDDTTKPSADDLRRTEADWIAARIKQLIQDNTEFVPDKKAGDTGHRRVTPGDIVILFRAMSNVPVYEDALRRHGIDYYLVGGRTFYAQQEVYDLINLCRTIAEPDDAVSLVGLLRSPFFSLNDESIFLLGRGDESITQTLFANNFQLSDSQQQRQARYAANVIKELREKKDRLPLFDLMSLAINRTGYDAALLMEHLGERKLANLWKLLEMARQFDSSGTRDFSDFVAELQDAIQDDADEELAATSPEAGNTVRLMSIHQSKGLEFPVVFVADMNRQQKPQDSGDRLHPEMGPLVGFPKIAGERKEHPGIIADRFFEKQADQEEAIRLLYVAMTRAAELLILSGSMTSNEKMQNNWMALLDRKFHLDTGLAKTDPILGRFTLGSLKPEHIPDIRVHRERPEFEKTEASRTKKLKLGDFETVIADADATPPHRISEPIASPLTPRETISVSEVASLDAQITSVKHHFETTASSSRSAIDSASRFGSLVHGILERIDFGSNAVSAEDISQLATSAVAALGESPTETELHEAIERCVDFLNSPTAQDLRAATKLYRELPFMMKWKASGISIQGTIDCLFQDRDGRWNLLDYKTGLVAANQDAVLAHYGIQLAIYALAISRQTGQLPDSTRLILLREKTNVVDINWTDKLIEDFSHRIDRVIQDTSTQA